MEHGLPEEQHVCAGLLAVMAQEDEYNNLHLLFRPTTEGRILGAMKRIFQAETVHDRSKVHACD
jgi:hypothetical protein